MAEKVTVLVTGASGYVASELVRQLIGKGYAVRGTVRSLHNAKHLQKLFPEVKLVQADLLKDGSFDEAVSGVQVVFHTASPFPAGPVKDPQRELIDPALQGTLNVLRSVDKSPSVRRVVLTSSVAAIARGKPAEYVYSEKDWNTVSTVEKEGYARSKTVAEEAAWKFSKGKKWDLAVICPSFVIGPPLSERTDATSIQALKALLEGANKETKSAMAFGAISVVDVGRAHILAAEKKEAGGQRYLVSSEASVSREQLCQYLVKSGEFRGFPLEQNEFKPPLATFRYSNAKVQKELGLKITPIDQTVVEAARALVKLGIVKPKSKL